eukprot:783101_1
MRSGILNRPLDGSFCLNESNIAHNIPTNRPMQTNAQITSAIWWCIRSVIAFIKFLKFLILSGDSIHRKCPEFRSFLQILHQMLQIKRCFETIADKCTDFFFFLLLA